MQVNVVLFYTVMIGFAIGIFLRSFLDIGFSGIYFLLLLSFGVGAVWGGGQIPVFAPHLLFASAFLFAAALGLLRMDAAISSFASSQFETKIGNEIVMEGTIVREPDLREFNTHLYVKTDDELMLVIADRFQSFSYGDVVSVTGILAVPEAFETDLGRTFEYPRYLEARGVRYTVRYPEIIIREESGGNPVLGTILLFKHTFMERIEKIIPEPYVGLSEGLLLGVKRALGDELEHVFRTTGIIHIVVLSGYNIMLVVVFVTFVLGALIPRRWQLPFGVAAIAAFALMVGLSATVVRASVMAVLYLVTRSLNRTYMVIRALMLAGAVMLMLNPHLLAFDTGFQLSFVATLGLILLAPYLDSLFSFIPKMLGREFLVATLATQIFVLPILLYQIGEFSVVSVVVNVLVLPMVPVAMLLTFVTGLVSFVSVSLASVLGVFTYLSLTYILVVAEWFAALPFASYVVPAFPFWVAVLGYVGLAYMLWRLMCISPSTSITPNHNHRSPTSVMKGAAKEVDERKAEDVGEEVDELVGWVIEEEDDAYTKVAASRRGAATDTPIFFR